MKDARNGGGRRSSGNRGRTSLKCKRRTSDPMKDFDGLPRELRIWLASAALPWRPRSVRSAYEKAIRRTGDLPQALEELTRIEARLIAKDAQRIWGQAHPAAD